MKKYIVYALGQVYEKNKKCLDGLDVVAYSDLKCEAMRGSKTVISPLKIHEEIYDYVVVFSNAQFQRITSFLSIQCGVPFQKILYWRELLTDVCELHSPRILELYHYLESTGNVLDLTPEFVAQHNYSNIVNSTVPRRNRKISRYNSIISFNKYFEPLVLLPKLSKRNGSIYFCVPYGSKYMEMRERILNEYGEHGTIRKMCENEYALYVFSPRISTSIDAVIYPILHRESYVFHNEWYLPISAGEYCEENSLSDDLHDNISALNPKINECTAIYWVWKNRRTDIVGFCHYRRYFYNDSLIRNETNILDKGKIEEILGRADIITAEHISFSMSVSQQLRYTLSLDAYQQGLRIFERVFAKYHSDDLWALKMVFGGYYMFPCNMFVTRWELFDAYAAWLFPMLIEAAEAFESSQFDAYNKRTIGFIAERMLTVWIVKNGLKVFELPITDIDG